MNKIKIYIKQKITISILYSFISNQSSTHKDSIQYFTVFPH